jgi:hypothetical protein
MLAIIGFLAFLAGGALAYSAGSYPAYEQPAKIAAGILLTLGLVLLGINLRFMIDAPYGH